MGDPAPYPGAPRWVKRSGILVAVLVLLAIVAVLTGVGGPHGPGRHLSPADGVPAMEEDPFP